VNVVDFQEGDEFGGRLIMTTAAGLIEFPFMGRLVPDASGVLAGAFKGRGFLEGVGEVRFDGFFQMLPDGAALVHAAYTFLYPDGSRDRGTTRLLRSFQPPDPVVPDIRGDWQGTARSDLMAEEREFALDITSQEGTSFDGVAQVSGIQPCVIVGTVGRGGQFLYIGVSPLEGGTLVLAGGLIEPLPEDGFGFNARFTRRFVSGALDLGTFEVRRLR
jgi:hypothetical protein